MDEEQKPFIEKDVILERRSNSIARFNTIISWSLVILLSVYIFVSSLLTSPKHTSNHLWTSTDFPPARGAIKQASVPFTSSLDFTDPEHIYRIFDPHSAQYVGNASKEIDENWDELILPADIYISDEEAVHVAGDLYRNEKNGKFKVELEVFHSLHCLNMLRMRVYGEAYPEMQTHNAKIHVDHCIESLRELIMCGGNMTPIPLEWSDKGERLNPNYAQRHACRDFDALKGWMKNRVDHVP